MAKAARKSNIFANPFYVLLMVVSTLFVMTALGYLVSPYALDARSVPLGERSQAFAGWLDRNGPLMLGVEFVIMLVAGVLAMVTDDWFSGARKPDVPSKREIL
jgi:hypothetical protein